MPSKTVKYSEGLFSRMEISPESSHAICTRVFAIQKCEKLQVVDLSCCSIIAIRRHCPAVADGIPE
jgi:hypothetical protein